jgi:phosphohistidine phosphatase SixA
VPDVLVYVVRHACAGWKSAWDGDDAERPLDEAGEAQAEALARVLAQRRPRRLYSSPARRCIDSLLPLARLSGLEVEMCERLAVGTPLDDLLALLHEPGSDHAVLCTHGEVMGQLLAALRRQGLEVTIGDPSDEELLAKGNGWELHLGDGPPRLARLAPFPPRPCPAHG